MRRSLPGRDEAELYWALHFALAMSHHTIREKERLIKLSEGKCDLGDVEDIIERVVSVSVMALTGGEAEKQAAAPDGGAAGAINPAGPVSRSALPDSRPACSACRLISRDEPRHQRFKMDRDVQKRGEICKQQNGNEPDQDRNRALVQVNDR